MNNYLINTILDKNIHLTRNVFGKLISALSLDGEKKFKSGMYITAWTPYTIGNVVGQYRRVGDRCEWGHPQGIAPYKHLCLDVVPNTEVLNKIRWASTPGGSAQIVQWAGGGVVNLGSGPVGFGIGNYTTTSTSVSTWSTTTNTTLTNNSNSNYTILIPHGTTIKTTP
jgi:hypothetical protein